MQTGPKGSAVPLAVLLNDLQVPMALSELPSGETCLVGQNPFGDLGTELAASPWGFARNTAYLCLRIPVAGSLRGRTSEDYPSALSSRSTRPWF